MRSKPVEPVGGVLLALQVLAVFVLWLVTLQYVMEIDPWIRSGHLAVIERLPMAQSGDLDIIVYSPGADLESAPGRDQSAVPASAAELEAYRPILSQELARYPRELLRAIGLRRIVLCSRLTLEGKEIGGFARTRAVFLNVQPSATAGQDQALRRAIHHEIFHVVDSGIGSAERWARLNPAGFEYGGDEMRETLQDMRINVFERPEAPGFVDGYCMVSAQEERAELFAFMVLAPAELAEIAAGDEIIARKVRALREELFALDDGFRSILGGLPTAVHDAKAVGP